MIDSIFLPHFDLFQQLVFWLSSSMYSSRKGRQYLETNPTLLERNTDRELTRLITAEAEDKPEMRLQMNNHLLLLQDARRRGETSEAIREAYINIYGGFALDLPAWLEDIEQRRQFLGQLRRPERTKKASITLLRQTLSQAQQDKDTAQETIAELQNELGVQLLQSPYPLTQSLYVQTIQDAIACHDAALSVYTIERYPFQYAKTLIYKGSAYLHYTITKQYDVAEQAIACYEAALQLYTPDLFPSQWQQLQTLLGKAYTLRISGDANDNIEQALAYHRVALQEMISPPVPTQWATIHINLGDAYRQRSIGIRANNLKQALTCYRAALQVFTPHAYPYEWAAIHSALAAIFQEQQIEDAGQRDMNLRCSIVCYEGALQVYTTDAFPVEHATTQVLLGKVHCLRKGGERVHNLAQATKCYTAALATFTCTAFPTEYRQTQRYLDEARAAMSPEVP